MVQGTVKGSQTPFVLDARFFEQFVAPKELFQSRWRTVPSVLAPLTNFGCYGYLTFSYKECNHQVHGDVFDKLEGCGTP